MKNLILMLVAGASLLSAGAQTSTGRYAAGAGGEGTVYFLPRTVIQVDVLVEKSHYKPGQFARYAERYLRLRDVPQTDTTGWRVISVRQTAVAVPDTSKTFRLHFDARSAAANLVLADDGRLLAINDQPAETKRTPPFRPAPKPKRTDARQYLSQDILVAGSAAKMAELTSEEIFDVRENRALLVKGQADFMPKDGRQLELMLQELDRENEALTAMFGGTTELDTTLLRLHIDVLKPVERQVLFRFSAERGLMAADDLGGEPYYVTVADATDLPQATPEEAARAAKRKPVENGLYVSVPGQMKALIERGTTRVSELTMPAPQFGSVELLSGALFNKKFTTRLQLNPLTGAIHRLQAELPEGK